MTHARHPHRNFVCKTTSWAKRHLRLQLPADSALLLVLDLVSLLLVLLAGSLVPTPALVSCLESRPRDRLPNQSLFAIEQHSVRLNHNRPSLELNPKRLNPPPGSAALASPRSNRQPLPLANLRRLAVCLARPPQPIRLSVLNRRHNLLLLDLGQRRRLDLASGRHRISRRNLRLDLEVGLIWKVVRALHRIRNSPFSNFQQLQQPQLRQPPLDSALVNPLSNLQRRRHPLGSASRRNNPRSPPRPASRSLDRKLRLLHRRRLPVASLLDSPRRLRLLLLRVALALERLRRRRRLLNLPPVACLVLNRVSFALSHHLPGKQSADPSSL